MIDRKLALVNRNLYWDLVCRSIACTRSHKYKFIITVNLIVLKVQHGQRLHNKYLDNRETVIQNFLSYRIAL